MAEETASDIENELATTEQQIAELQKKRDIASLTGIKALKDLLTTGNLGTIEADLTALLPQTGNATTIGQNIGQILSVVRGALANAEREIARIQPLADAAAEE